MHDNNVVLYAEDINSNDDNKFNNDDTDDADNKNAFQLMMS